MGQQIMDAKPSILNQPINPCPINKMVTNLPSLAWYCPFQRKPIISLSMALSTNWWMSMDGITRMPFNWTGDQPLFWQTAASSLQKASLSVCRNLRWARHWIFFILHCSILSIITKSSSWQWMGVSEHIGIMSWAQHYQWLLVCSIAIYFRCGIGMITVLACDACCLFWLMLLTCSHIASLLMMPALNSLIICQYIKVWNASVRLMVLAHWKYLLSNFIIILD